MRAKYVLITPARNEEAFIEKTIQSVLAQTVLPEKWVIVSDGSTDRTDEIVEEYTKKYDFIELVRRSGDQQRNFGSKAKAVEYGYGNVKKLEFDFIGNLDADISLDSTYYAGILSKFLENERLGVAGGIRFDFCNGRFIKKHCARNSVGGPFQLFRRQCYEEIGGYRPLRFGGIDAVAETMARMYGWHVESFPEFQAYHHRCTGTARGSVFRGSFRLGIQHYVIGYHPLFETTSCIAHLLHYPLVIGSLTRLAGYTWAALKKYEKVMPDDFIRYIRSEQLGRLRSMLLTGQDATVGT